MSTMNLLTLSDLPKGAQREIRDFTLRLKVLRQRRPHLFLEALRRAGGFAPCFAEPGHIAKQIHLFGRVLADLEAEAEAPALEGTPAVEAVEHGDGRDDDHGDGGRDLRESVARLGVAWAARMGGRMRR